MRRALITVAATDQPNLGTRSRATKGIVQNQMKNAMNRGATLGTPSMWITPVGHEFLEE